MEQQYVGILVNHSVYKGIRSGRTRHERLIFYEEAAYHHGIKPCYFRLDDLRFGRRQVSAIVRSHRGYTKRIVPIPKVIHNRGLYFNSKDVAKLKRLSSEGTMVFNASNRYGKLKTHDVLMLDEQLRPHLPGTVSATLPNLRYMMSQYDSLILKPNSSSIGRGIMKLEKNGHEWYVKYPHRRTGKITAIRIHHQLPLWFRRKLKAQSYLIQQCLPLATYKGRPFDIRVSIQRNETGHWTLTGMIGKVAAKGKYVTNVAQGATVHSVRDILQEYPDVDPQFVEMQIADFCLKAATHLGQHLPHLADLGFDIGITPFGFPMFIECNGRDLRYSFKEGHMIEEWKRCYWNPIGYAKYLLNTVSDAQLGFHS